MPLYAASWTVFWNETIWHACHNLVLIILLTTMKYSNRLVKFTQRSRDIKHCYHKFLMSIRGQRFLVNRRWRKLKILRCLASKSKTLIWWLVVLKNYPPFKVRFMRLSKFNDFLLYITCNIFKRNLHCKIKYSNEGTTNVMKVVKKNRVKNRVGKQQVNVS